MVRSLIQILIITLFSCQSVLAAPNRCKSLFQAQYYSRFGKVFRDPILNLDYQKFSYVDKDYNYIANKDLSSQWIENKEVILSFDRRGHLSLYFQGYRIDSEGLPGFKVISYIRKSHITSGTTVIILKNLSAEATDKLKELILNFKSKHRVTCIKLICSYLEDADPIYFNKSPYLPSTLIEDLIILKQEKPEDIDFYFHASETPSEFLKELKQNQRDTTLIISSVTAIGSAASLTVGFYIGEVLKILLGL
jgi:hypothetical protein